MYKIRPLEEKDKDIYLDMLNLVNKEADEGLRQFVRESMWKLETNKESKAVYMVIDDITDSICGYCELKEDNSTPEIGIELLPDYQGKGIGEIAIRQMLELNKDRDDITYFLVRIKENNTPSIKLFQKLGAKPIDHRDSYFMQRLKSLVGTHEDFKEIVDELVDDDKDTLCFAIYPNK